MSNGLVQRIGRGRVALALPLIGLLGMWVVFLGAQISDLYQQNGANYGNYAAQQNEFHLSTYLFLIGVALLGLTAVSARRMARQLHATALERAVRGFSLVAVFVALIVGAVFGIGNFMANFMTDYSYPAGSGYVAPSELMRVFNVYIPIVLDAGIMVFVIIRAFVNPVDDEEEAKAGTNV
ncbi:MAG: hypothetical protein RLZZ603_395 [Actinomycetota bacterium]|jgi:MFS family permease